MSSRNYKTRDWLPYEKNHLLRHGFSLDNLEQYGTKPVEYITGWAEFGPHQFKVNRHTLIPRVETEQLVELICDDIKQRGCGDNQIKIADVGAGSGVIGISILLKLKALISDWKITFIDINPQALQTAKENWQRLVVGGQEEIDRRKSCQANFIRSDLLASLSDSNQFDLIAANLPYVPTDRLDNLPASVRDHEPIAALAGGEDGLKYIDKLIAQAQSFLLPEGRLWLEVDHQADLNSYRKNDQYSCHIFRDRQGRQRFIKIVFE